MVHASSFGAKALAVSLSASAHAAIALIAARHGLTATPLHAAAPPIVEMTAPDLELTEATVPAAPAPALMSNADVDAAATKTRVEKFRSALRHTHPDGIPPDHDAIPHHPSLVHTAKAAPGDSGAPAAAPSVIEASAPAAEPATPHFAMTVGTATRAAGGATSSDAVRSDSTSTAIAGGNGEPAPESAVDVAAKLVAGEPPRYRRAAEVAAVEAEVPLEIVVDASGKVMTARSLAHVGYGLDEAALRGVRAYKFAPARRHGEPIAVRMRWVMRFELR